QKKQLVLATITVLVFCAVTITGLFLLPLMPSSATEVGGDDYPEVPAPASVVAPQRVDGLIYNGRPQTLITAGQEDITYSLDDENHFTADLPQAVTAGVHYVYYKVADNDTVYSLYSIIAKKERQVSVQMENWNYTRKANEPTVTLMEGNGTVPQITYYQNGQRLYRKPSTVGQYTVAVTVPADVNYQACSATQKFAITSQIELLFDANLVGYENVTVHLGPQTQDIDLTLYSRTKIFNALAGTQTLTVTAGEQVVFQQVINAGENQQIKVKG
ncbi:MAG: hypothetical protein NC133_04555, partial [Prevotella sp.]|nr:hypothetical protein [Prevotella sp.]